jgi:hypothetical protein
MVLVIPAALYVFALTYLYGSAAVVCLDRLLPSANRHPVPLSLVNVTGLVVIAVIAGYLSLCMPIGMAANLIVSVMGIICFVLTRKDTTRLAREHLKAARTANTFAVALFLVLCVFALSEVLDQPKVGDAGLYHLQTMKWIAHYGVVPGLGNLHGMYALNSMWYPLSALFGLTFLGIPSLHILNGILFLLVAGFFLGGVTELLNGSSSSASIIKAASLLFALFAYAAHIGSLSTDLPVAVFIWVAFIVCVEHLDPDRMFRSRTLGAILSALIAYTLTVKLAAAPLALLYLYLLYLQVRAKQWPALWLQLGTGAIILIPWVARNVILSGYLVYPFPYLDVWNVDWKIPYQQVIYDKVVNHGWARLPGSQWREALDMPLWEWVPQWFRLERTYKLTIAAAFLIMPAYLAAIVVRARRQRGPLPVSDVLYLIAGAGVAYWFVNAPDPRFGFGFVFPALILPAVPLVEKLLVRFKRLSGVSMAAIVVLYMGYKTLMSVQGLPRTMALIWSPVPYPVEPLWIERIDGVVFYGARTGFCWDAPLPCTPIMNKQIRPRGKNLASGFRMARGEPSR